MRKKFLFFSEGGVEISEYYGYNIDILLYNIDHLMYSAKAYVILFTCTFVDYSFIIPLLNQLALDCQIWKSLIIPIP